MFYKIISFLTSILLTVSTMLPALLGGFASPAAPEAAAAGMESVSDYMDEIQQNGVPSLSSELFLKLLSPFTAARRLIAGFAKSESRELFVDLTLDETLREMSDYLLKNTGLDVNLLLTHLPDYTATLPDALAEGLQIDTEQFRKEVYRLADSARDEGHTLLATAMYAFAVFFSVTEKVSVYCVPSQTNPDEVVAYMDVVYRDGKTETLDPDITINKVTGEVRNTNKEDAGMSGFGFNINIYDLTLYATVHSWQRSYGFTVLYDAICAVMPNFNYVTRRYTFDYNGKEWLVQIFKGNYAMISNGAEVGTYYREPGSFGTYYNAVSDEDMMEIGFELYHNDTLLTKAGPSAHWWQNAFKLSKTLYLPQSLTLNFTIQCPDEAFLQALTAAIDAHPAADVHYTVNGTLLSCVW